MENNENTLFCKFIKMGSSHTPVYCQDKDFLETIQHCVTESNGYDYCIARLETALSYMKDKVKEGERA